MRYLPKWRRNNPSRVLERIERSLLIQSLVKLDNSMLNTQLRMKLLTKDAYL